MDTQVEIEKFTVVREVLCWSRDIISPYHFWGINPRDFDFVHQTVSRQEMHAGWAQDYVETFYISLDYNRLLCSAKYNSTSD